MDAEIILNKNNENKRVNYVDVLKFWGIFLLFIDHTGNSIKLTGFYENLRIWICSFHMPLFFISYGLIAKHYEIKNKKDFINFLSHKAYGIIIPYILWSALYSVNYSWRFFAGIFYGSNKSLGFASTNAVLWFLPTFFLSEIFFQLALNIKEKILIYLTKHKKNYVNGGGIILLILLTIYCFISYLLSKLKIYIPIVKIIDFPFSFDVSFLGSAFMLLGILTKPFYEKIRKCGIGIKILIIIPVFILTFILSQLNKPINQICSVMAWGIYGKSYICFFILACLSTLVIAIISMMTENIHLFQRLGQNSIISMTCHYIVFIYTIKLSKILMQILQNLQINQNISSIFIVLFNSIMTYIGCGIFIFFINKFVPNLKGKK